MFYLLFLYQGVRTQVIVIIVSENDTGKIYSNNPWSDINATEIRNRKIDTKTLSLVVYRTLNLDEDLMKLGLEKSVDALDVNDNKKATLNNNLLLPLPDGTYVELIAKIDQLLTPEIADQMPDAHTWSVSGSDDRVITGTIDISQIGFHAMLLMSDGDIVYIDPKENNEKRYYVSYRKSDNGDLNQQWSCGADAKDGPLKSLLNNSEIKLSKRFVSTLRHNNRRTYRLAVTATNDFHNRFGWRNGRQSVWNTWGYVLSVVNRVRLLVRKDLSVDLVLTGNPNNLVIDATPATDPFYVAVSTNPPRFRKMTDSEFLIANQQFLDNPANLGSANYDLGHVFDIGNGSGLASTSVACAYNWKARGYSQWARSTNNFATSVVAHEIGHQLGAGHTFNSNLGGCLNNWTPASAVEPGSGSTIMSYGNLCGADSLQAFDNRVDVDPMYHSQSIREVHDYVHRGAGASCGRVSLFNHNPQVDLDEFRTNRLVIPAQTPFILGQVKARDANDKRTYYSWEQVMPSRPPSTSRLNTDTGRNALVRTNLPTWTTQRIIPSISALVSGRMVDGEVVPRRSRAQLRFRFVARDMHGGVGYDDVNIRIHNTGRPFRVLQPNTTRVREGSLNVQWDVANTNVAPISCQNVEISASQNNGRIFTPLISETANDGFETINIPSWLATSQTRIRVKCATDIFFAISATNPANYTAR